jgi:hypothetical protein
MTIEVNYQSCGAPTRSGEPCKNTLTRTTRFDSRPSLSLCGVHASQEQKDQWAHDVKLWEAGRRVGVKSAMAVADNTLAHLRQRIAELEAANAAHEWVAKAKMRDTDGAQLVTVDGYAYRWTGSPDLQVGDYVKIPGPFWHPGTTRVGQVAKLGSVWDGEHVEILRRFREGELPAENA